MLFLLFVKNDPAHYQGGFMRQRETKKQRARKQSRSSQIQESQLTCIPDEGGSLVTGGPSCCKPPIAPPSHPPPPFPVPHPPLTSAADIFTASADRPFEPADSDAPRPPAVTDALVDRQPPAAGWGLPDPFNFDWPQW